MRIELTGLGEIIRKSRTDDFYNCIYCDDTKGHLGVSRNKEIFHCFKCGASGRIKELKPNLNEFADQVKAKLQEINTLITPLEQKDPLKLPLGFIPITEEKGLAFNYLKKRELSLENITEFEIGKCWTGFFAHRIIVPIYEGNKLNYFVGRSYINASPRYMNSPVSKKGIIFSTFGGLVDRAVICEGLFDALRIQKVIPAIAILGKVADQIQISKIAERVVNPLVMLDNDAKKEGFELYNQLSRYRKTKLILIDQKDPGEMSTVQLKEVLHAYLH